VLSLVIHVIVLGPSMRASFVFWGALWSAAASCQKVAVVMGVAALLATVLHGIEAAIWASRRPT